LVPVLCGAQTLRVQAPAAAVGEVTVANLVIRVGPGATVPALAYLTKGDRVLVLEEVVGGSCRIVTPAGGFGFVPCSSLTRTPGLAMVPGVSEITADADSVLIRVDPPHFEKRESVAPGISYTERQWTRNGDGPFTMQVLEVDPAHPAVNLLPVRARDRAIGKETTSSMARRYGATAAINAGYFVVGGAHAGVSVGVYLWNGQVLSGGSGRTALLFCEETGDRERLAFDVVDFQGAVITTGGERTPISGVNRERAPSNDLVAYRSSFGPRTLTGSGGVEAVLDAAGTVLQFADGQGGATIPEGGTVLSGTGTAAEWLRQNARPGARLTLDLALHAPSEASCRPTDIAGGGPRLVQQGRLSAAWEGFGHAQARHPRTAVAITSRGTLLFVTLDGRQTRSAGMRLDEFAAELIALGATEAINLDGGGSTTMVVRGDIRNWPSDGSERPVSDALLIYSIPDAGALQNLRETLDSSGLDWAKPRLLPEAGRGVAALRGSR
jgi:exopolysaccharide biosynthesis protein